jgi:uncharacterized membrane protein YecN with MAPEG domain
MLLKVTPLYAGLLALLFVALSIRVIAVRRSAGVALGDGDRSDVRRRMRVHGNFAEYVPLALLLLALAEINLQPALLLHGLGLALLAGRCIHAVGVSGEPERFVLRVTGMALTFGTILVAAALNLAAAAGL